MTSASNAARRARPLIAPSLLSSDFARLADEARALEAEGADWLHVDVMDGHFVPNLTIGPCVVKALAKITELPLDCHLMISDPETYAPQFADAGAGRITFHLEASDDPEALIDALRARGVEVGVALKPGTPVEGCLALLPKLAMVLIMTVEPGFGGQAFMADMMSKVELLAATAPAALDIQVDGGLNPETTAQAAAAGANVIVAGSAIFKSADRAGTIRQLREAVRGASSCAQDP